MASTVRLSPFGIFCVVSISFVIFYTAKHFMFSREPMVIDNQHMGENVPIKNLLEASIYLAEKGGAILKKIRDSNNLKEKSKGLTAEGVKDVLTEGDLQSHKAIVYGLHDLFPMVTVVSEEHDDDAHSLGDGRLGKNPLSIINISDHLHGDSNVQVPKDDILVWVDPLDATKEYTEMLVEYVTTMVCITVKGVPIAGIIHQPFLQKTLWAWFGHGHSKELSKPTENNASLKTPRIIVSRSHAGHVNQIALSAFGDGVKILPAGGAGFKVLSLFNDKADVYIHTTLIKKWDICAGDALLRSFGGKMTTLEGKEISYREQSSVKNSGGLLATLYNHEHFLNKLSVKDNNS